MSTVLPATYYIELERALVLRGANLGDFWFNLVMLAAMGIRCSATPRRTWSWTRRQETPAQMSCMKIGLPMGQTLSTKLPTMAQLMVILLRWRP